MNRKNQVCFSILNILSYTQPYSRFYREANCVITVYVKHMKEGKDLESIQSSTTPGPAYQ